MIQFNLLPDVKLEYIKTRRTKRTVLFVAGLTAASALTLFVLLFLVVGVIQKKYMNDLTKDIKTSSAKLQSIPDLDKILTIQNQLNSLPGLHEKKEISSRVFKYLQQVTPAQATIADFKIDLEAETISITGNADTINTINKFADTLKFTDYKSTDKDPARAFSGVVLTSFGRDDKSASYQIDMKYSPDIFDGLQDVSLIVPSIITTRSETEKPSALFQTINNSGQ